MEVLPPPGPERQRQLARLGVLLVILAGALWYALAPTGSRAPSSNPTGERAANAEGQLPVPEALKLDTLRQAGELAEAGRNPFVFGQRNEPSFPGSSFVTVPQPQVPSEPVPAGPPVPQGPPPIPLRLTGLAVVEAGGRTLVTLKDLSTDTLYHAYEGDVVDGRYRVVKVGIQSVVVSYLDGTGIRTLPLGG